MSPAKRLLVLDAEWPPSPPPGCPEGTLWVPDWQAAWVRRQDSGTRLPPTVTCAISKVGEQCLPPAPCEDEIQAQAEVRRGREQSPQVLGSDCPSRETRFLPMLTSADDQLFVSFKQSHHKPWTPGPPGTHPRADKHQILPHSTRSRDNANSAWGRGLVLAPGKGETGAGDTCRAPWRFPGAANHL